MIKAHIWTSNLIPVYLGDKPLEMKNPFLLLLFFILGPSSIFSQTCIVAKIHENEIFIGADTKFTQLQFNQSKREFDTTYISSCKLFSVDSFIYAPAGVKTDLQHKIADSILSLTLLPANTKLDLFIFTFGKQLGAILEDYRIKAKQTYMQILREHSPYISQTVFCFYENKIPLIVVIQFKVSGDGSEITKMSYEKNLVHSAIFDPRKEISQQLLDQKTWKDGIIKGIKKILHLSSKTSPLRVGPPFDIVRMSKDKITWIEKSGFCR